MFSREGRNTRDKETGRRGRMGGGRREGERREGERREPVMPNVSKF